MVHMSSTSNTNNKVYITEARVLTEDELVDILNAEKNIKRVGTGLRHGLIDFPLTIATGVIETSTIGEPLPYYGRDAAKNNMAGENIVGTAVWATTFTGCDISCRRGSHYTESVHIIRGEDQVSSLTATRTFTMSVLSKTLNQSNMNEKYMLCTTNECRSTGR